MEKLIELLEMMAKNNLSAWEEGSKIKHESYMKGKGDAFTEVISLLKQIETNSSANCLTKVDN